MFCSFQNVCSSLVVRLGDLLAGNDGVGADGVAAVPEAHLVPEDEAMAPFENEDVQDLSADLHGVLSYNTVDDMVDATRRGLTHQTLKNEGSVNHDRKIKSLRERWLTKEPKPVQADDSVAPNTMVLNYHVDRKSVV